MSKMIKMKQKFMTSALCMVLSLGVFQNSHAQLVVSDPGVLGKAIENLIESTIQFGKDTAHQAKDVAQFAKQTAHYVKQVTQWKTELQNWAKDYEVLTTAFDVINTVNEIRSGVGDLMKIGDDLKKEMDHLKRGGLKNLANEAYSAAMTGAYKNRSKAITSQCGKIKFYADKIADLSDQTDKVTKAHQDAIEKMQGLIKGGGDSSATKVGSSNGMVAAQKAAREADFKRIDLALASYKEELAYSKEICEKVKSAESENQKRQAEFSGVYGSKNSKGLSFKGNNQQNSAGGTSMLGN